MAAALDAVKRDPTLQSAGTGILLLATGAAFTIAALGFVTSLAFAVRRRTLEFAVLRAIGSSGRQLLRALLLEWAVVLAGGVAIGLLLGRQIARTMLSFLEVTDQGARVLPPFELATDWLLLAAAVGLLAALAGTVTVLLWAGAMRLGAASTLRRTE
jgi:ABC-type antimicrobial peptide transport system permease subunit